MSKLQQTKIPISSGMKVKITKIKELEDAKHPLNIEEGFVKIGISYAKPIVGERFWVDRFSTSAVQEIIDSNTFRTYNSIYKYEILDENNS